MPELPEVESTRRHIAPVLEGALITGVEVGRTRTARHNHHPLDVVHRLTGRKVRSVGRRGKFLVIDVGDDLAWVIHLGMSGRIQFASPGDPKEPHTNFVAVLDGATELRFVDPRTFGFVAVLTPDELAGSGVAHLGPDAFDDLPSLTWLADRLSGRKASIKSLLLDQRILAGLGNIYADEVLHRAGIDPRRPGGSLESGEVARLLDAVGPILSEGVAHGGTSLDDLAYLLPDGRAGEYLERLQVYARAGQPCRTCGAAIERIIIGQRSTHFCPVCQR